MSRSLGHPLVFLATALVLLALFGGTFVANPDRVAPTKDPAYYTWRTEVLISEDPVRLLEVRGAFEMFAGGYRIAAPVIGGYLRQVAGVSSLNTTSLLMVVVPVLTALLLAGFAYRQRRDPLIFHLVALGTASLYLTPPFVGYLDNILCLMFLAAALWFIPPARDSWPGRAGLFLFLLLSGFTHPTTLVIFCVTLGIFAFVRLLYRRFDLRSVLRDDGPMLVTAFASAVTIYLIWAAGIWGESASLTEAALPPPYDSSFFVDRMVGWIEAIRPLLNGPLLAIGLVGLLAMGRRAVDDDLARVGILWLAPLAGLFGFLAGVAYPYYRFFNTTLAWVLLVGLGAYFLMRFLLERASGNGIYMIATAVAAVAIGAIFATNLTAGFDQSGWNDPAKGWLSSQTRTDLDRLRAALAATPGRPVVFVVDDETTNFQIWGFTKLAGNTSRYGLPLGRVDQGYLYLGSLDNYLKGEPTLRGEATYDKLSPALLEDAKEGVERSGKTPVVVVADAFNATGANVPVASGEQDPPSASSEISQILVVHDGRVDVHIAATDETGTVVSTGDDDEGGPLHLLRVIGALLLLLAPGVLALRWFAPGAGLGEALGMVPALSIALLSVLAIAALALLRAPFSPGFAWGCLAVTLLVTAALAARAGASGRVVAQSPI